MIAVEVIKEIRDQTFIQFSVFGHDKAEHKAIDKELHLWDEEMEPVS